MDPQHPHSSPTPLPPTFVRHGSGGRSPQKLALINQSPPPPLATPSNPDALEELAARTQAAIYEATEEHMEHKKRPPTHNNAWWNDECTVVAAALREAGTRHAPQEETTALGKALTCVTRKAKHDWADKIVTNGNVWEIAKWRHGQKTSDIAALWNADNELTFNPEEMVHILAEHFFVQDTRNVQIAQHDDPHQTPRHPFEPFTIKEHTGLLMEASSTSVPSQSGVLWQILKLAWKEIKDHAVTIAKTCTTLRHHPQP